MVEARFLPFAVFESAAPRFSEVEPSWSFAYSDGRELVAVGANYGDDRGVALKIESIAPGTSVRSRMSRQPIAFAIARAESHRATEQHELAALTRRAVEAKAHAIELLLEIDLEGDKLVASTLGYDDYVAGTVEIGSQRVTVSGRALELPVRLRRRRTPLPTQTADSTQQ